MTKYLYLITILIFNGCPSAYTQPPPLSKNEGYLILDLQLGRKVTEISLKRQYGSISKEMKFGPFDAGRHLTLIKLPKGVYTITRISAPHYDLPFRVNYNNNPRMKILIKAKTTNYFAQIILGDERSSEAIDIRAVNRLATSMREFDAAINNAIAQYPLNYAGAFTDHFYQSFIAAETQVIK